MDGLYSTKLLTLNPLAICIRQSECARPAGLGGILEVFVSGTLPLHPAAMVDGTRQLPNRLSFWLQQESKRLHSSLSSLSVSVAFYDNTIPHWSLLLSSDLPGGTTLEHWKVWKLDPISRRRRLVPGALPRQRKNRKGPLCSASSDQLFEVPLDFYAAPAACTSRLRMLSRMNRSLYTSHRSFHLWQPPPP